MSKQFIFIHATNKEVKHIREIMTSVCSYARPSPPNVNELTWRNFSLNYKYSRVFVFSTVLTFRVVNFHFSCYDCYYSLVAKLILLIL